MTRQQRCGLAWKLLRPIPVSGLAGKAMFTSKSRLLVNQGVHAREIPRGWEWDSKGRTETTKINYEDKLGHCPRGCRATRTSEML